MRTIVITPPAAVVSLADAKAHSKVRQANEDDLIEMYVAAATAHIDGPGGWLGRAIGLQTLELRLNSFSCADIQLPYPEIVSIVSVKYLDSDGVEQTVDSGSYELFGRDISPAWGTSWPSPRSTREAVRIRYQAGYADGAVPEPIRAAILLMTGDLYAQRETFVSGTISTAVPMSATVENLLGPFRVFA